VDLTPTVIPEITPNNQQVNKQCKHKQTASKQQQKGSKQQQTNKQQQKRDGPRGLYSRAGVLPAVVPTQK